MLTPTDLWGSKVARDGMVKYGAAMGAKVACDGLADMLEREQP